jgi:hypothetical protein
MARLTLNPLRRVFVLINTCMKKIKPKKLTKEEQAAIDALIAKVDESVKCIVDNIEHLDSFRRDDLIEAINPIGANIKINNLNEYYKVSEFCEANNIQFETNAFY